MRPPGRGRAEDIAILGDHQLRWSVGGCVDFVDDKVASILHANIPAAKPDHTRRDVRVLEICSSAAVTLPYNQPIISPDDHGRSSQLARVEDEGVVVVGSIVPGARAQGGKF